MYCDRGASGYNCKWGAYSLGRLYGEEKVQEWIEQIEKGTGIKCTMSWSGKLVIPYAE